MKITWLFVFVGLLFILNACQEQKQEEATVEKPKKAEYVGAQSCQSCHTEAFNKWQNSHHFEAMHEATNKTVLATWEGAFTADGIENAFYKNGDQFMLAMTEEGITDTLQITSTFGFYPLQQYLFKADGGRLQTLRATWDSEKNQWFNQHTGEEIPRGDWLHQEGQSMTWNVMCASCHSTNLKKDYNAQTKSYNTTFSHINLTCESCHGPGSLHIELAEDEANYNTAHSGLKDFEGGFEGQLDMCGGCHARREELYDNIQPNDKFQDAYNIAWLNDRLYFPDGQIDEEDYVLGSFLSSKMHENGVMCMNCHDSHSMELHVQGNQLCMSCHEPQYNTPEHHFHEQNTDGAMCINCHMDGKHYMGNDYRRDHSFRIPRPDQSVAYGTPNACNSCHTDQDAQWSAKHIVNWYGKERPPHFSDKLLSGYMDGELGDLIALANDTATPAIIRGTAIHYLSEAQFYPEAQQLDVWLMDEEYLVRKAALEIVQNLPADNKVQFVSRLFKDRARSVRIEAIGAALDLDPEQLAPSAKAPYQLAMNEYLQYLDHVADFPDGLAKRAQYHFAKQEFEPAIQAYKEALEMDSLRVDLRTNLAVIYNMVGQNDQALQELNLCIAQEENHRTYYLRGLLQAEQKDLPAAASDLQEAIALNGQIPTYYYNLVLVYNQLEQTEKARKTLREGMEKFPTDQRLASLQQFVN